MIFDMFLATVGKFRDGGGKNRSTVMFLSAILAAGGFSGCRPQSLPDFPRVHAAPRVFVYHTPLWPKPGDTVRIIAQGRPGALDTRLGDLEITVYTGDAEQAIRTRECQLEPQSVWISCDLELDQPDVANVAYKAEMKVGRDETVVTPIFTYDTRPSESAKDRLYVLRAPLLRRTEAFQIVLTRACLPRQPLDQIPCDARYPEDTFVENVQVAINDRLLTDPALRWRSEQLAWLYYARSGQVADAYSGLTARCGADPWPSSMPEVRLPEVLRNADVIGALHLQVGEGESFRDCASHHVQASEIATFSAMGSSVQTIQHELGHALFELGDEYSESESTRALPAGSDALPSTCSCCDDGEAIGPNGGIEGGCDDNELPCSEPLSALCYNAGSSCPGLAGTCANLFATETECHDFADRLGSQVWIESRAGSCNQLCGGDNDPCPCDGAPELWRFDLRNPPSGDSDVMGNSEAGDPEALVNHFGPACTTCIEGAFCMRWTTRMQGLSEEDASLFCQGDLRLTLPSPP